MFFSIQWPGHERWFDMRVSPLSSEFTIHQNTVIAAFVYGFLTDGATADIEEGVITDVQKKSEDQKVTVFPNPSQRSVTVSSTFGFTKVEIYSTEGKLIMDQLYDSQQHEIQLDVEHFKAGLYFIEIYNKQGESRIVKLVLND